MNLIDAHVTKVIDKKQYTSPPDWAPINGVVYDIFTVEYWDDGGAGQVTDLWFKADLNMDIQPGFVFQH